MKSSEGFCSFKGPFFPVFYHRECLGCAGQEGMVAGDEHKRQQKGSLFMTLTLIVAGPAMPAVPRFPRICHQRKDISHTCWEGDPTSYAWLFQPTRFHRRLSQSWAEEERTGKLWQPLLSSCHRPGGSGSLGAFMTPFPCLGARMRVVAGPRFHSSQRWSWEVET